MSKYKIKDLADEISERVNDPKKSGFDKFIGLEHYTSGEARITRFGSTANLDSSAKIFHSGDILIARRNVYLKRAGIVDFDGLTSGDSIVIRAKNDTIRQILPFIFNTEQFWDFATQFADGSMSKRLSPKILMEYEINLSDDEKEREKLAKTLWAINDTLDSYKEMLKQSDELIKAKFVEMFGDPILNDKNLPTKQLSQCITLKGPKEISPKDNVWNLNLDMVESGTGDIIQKVIVPRDKLGTSVYYFNNEYILYSKLRPYLNKVVLPDEDGYATTELVPMKPYDFINKTFLASLLRSDSFVNYINKLSFGAKMPRAPMDKIRNFPIILPQLELQSIFEKYVIEINQSKLILKKCILKLEALYKKIVNQYITKEENE